MTRIYTEGSNQKLRPDVRHGAESKIRNKQKTGRKVDKRTQNRTKTRVKNI